MSALCSVDGCAKSVRARGMCEPHYDRAKTYGDPLHMHDKVCTICGSAFKSFHKATQMCSDGCRKANDRARDRSNCLKGDFTCADCAKPMFRGRTSAPQGEARCLDCRNAGRGYYVTPSGRRRSHGQSAYAHGCRCDVCRSAVADRMSAWHARYAEVHGEGYSSTWRRKFKAEHGFWPQGSGTEFVDAPTRRSIYERDGWVCQLCDGAISPDATEHADRASLDHIVPQSRGGSHDPSNLRMAHVGCNARRGDRVGVVA